MLKKEDTLRKRYLSKLFTNFVALFVGILTQAIIPRGLGPKAYGDFNFLTNFFTQIIGFLNMGTAIGFYIKLSKRQEEFGLVSFYLSFTLIIFLCIFAFTGTALWIGTKELFWPGQKQIYIYFGALWAVFYWGHQVLNKMIDAYGITISAEYVKIIQKIFGFILILSLFLSNQLNLFSFFIYHYIIFFFLCLIFVWLLHKKGFSLFRNWHLARKQTRSYIVEFYEYSHPLILLALVGMVTGILDRWLLQHFSGSVEQGFFSLSYQIGATCFLFTSAMTPLITREFSIAFGNKDIKKMAHLFRRYIPMLYAIAAYFGCFIAVHSDAVTFILGGEKFGHATLVVMIMAFFPIHQTYGQLSGSIFFATGNTKLYRNIGVTFMLLGLPITYFLLAPAEEMGLSAGAIGLAIKMVALQFVWVNVQLFFNTRFLELKFKNYVSHQIFSVLIMVCYALLANFMTREFLAFNTSIIINFIISGILYTLLVGLTTMVIPALFGLHKKDIQSITRTVFRKKIN